MHELREEYLELRRERRTLSWDVTKDIPRLMEILKEYERIETELEGEFGHDFLSEHDVQPTNEVLEE